MNTTQAHDQLIVLGLEVLLVLGLATVASASPPWGAPILMLVVLLWGVYLLQHSQQLVNLFSHVAAPQGGAGGGGNLTP